MSSYPVPTGQHDRLIRAALRSLAADNYPNENDPHADAESEYASEQLALAARELARAVDQLPEEQQPIGWDKATEPKPAAPVAALWTGPDGTIYDLGHGWRDRDGDVWVCLGWIVLFDGAPVPLMECDSVSERTNLPEVIERYGPITMRTDD